MSLTRGENRLACLFGGVYAPFALFAVAPFVLRGLEKELPKPDITVFAYRRVLDNTKHNVSQVPLELHIG